MLFRAEYDCIYGGVSCGKVVEVDPGQYMFEPRDNKGFSQSMLRDIADAIDKLEALGSVLPYDADQPSTPPPEKRD